MGQSYLVPFDIRKGSDSTPDVRTLDDGFVYKACMASAMNPVRPKVRKLSPRYSPRGEPSLLPSERARRPSPCPVKEQRRTFPTLHNLEPVLNAQIPLGLSLQSGSMASRRDTDTFAYILRSVLRSEIGLKLDGGLTGLGMVTIRASKDSFGNDH